MNGAIDEDVKGQVVVQEPSIGEKLDPGSAYSKWTKTEGIGGKVGSDEVPAQYLFYLFNISNPEETLWGRSPAVLVQMGPYVYDIHSSKFEVTFDTAQSQVTYKVHEWLEYRQDLSKGNAATAESHFEWATQFETLLPHRAPNPHDG